LKANVHPIIQVRNLGKRYDLRRARPPRLTLREATVAGLKRPIANFGKRNGSEGNSLWALRHVNFDVFQGEVVGIIGPNGAGKSTLLKIISRITKPSEGEVDIYGRVGSLLEIGTGFHPDLTGRENIYMNAAILGMKRVEIKRKLDEIISFSEVESFIDNPVKFYSSGMYVRLAFSVAAHLESEILILDEVLAVGDASFKKKCAKKMREVSREGRTILLVSHNMPSIAQLCGRVFTINHGQLTENQSAASAIAEYESSSANRQGPTRIGTLNIEPPHILATDAQSSL
jgi:lipopolysaccharide transport system ATP-binding protein